MGVRRMAKMPWPGFEEGGVAWFTDLTLPAVQWTSTTLNAPMGSLGVILPLCVSVSMFINLQVAFGNPSPGLSLDNLVAHTQKHRLSDPRTVTVHSDHQRCAITPFFKLHSSQVAWILCTPHYSLFGKHDAILVEY